MTIRPARTTDAAAIAEMCKSSMRATYCAFFTDDQMAPWIEGGETERYVESAITGMLVAEDDGAVIGVAAITDDLVDLMWVALEARGGGIGAALLAAAERTIRETGHPAARLEVFVPNTDAIRFYERHGWRRGDSFPDPDAGIDKLAMSKALG
jgi:putative acetyltransferase